MLMQQLETNRRIEEYKRQQGVLGKAAQHAEDTTRTIEQSFGSLLKQAQEKKQGITISKHAQLRAEQRGIDLSATVLEGIGRAVERAQQKGIKDLVIIGDESAYVVNVPNKVMVTSMDKQEMKENVFTNINGAVIL